MLTGLANLGFDESVGGREDWREGLILQIYLWSPGGMSFQEDGAGGFATNLCWRHPGNEVAPNRTIDSWSSALWKEQPTVADTRIYS